MTQSLKIKAAWLPLYYEMKQKISGFDKDDEDHWRAILECGHRQHLRHNPPMATRPWVLTEAGRASRIGFELECKRCDEEPDALPNP